MIGTTLQNRYRLDAELGQGGMGMVYRAFDTLLERPVAIKVMSEAVAMGTEGRARLMHEARATAQLNHPNIVSLYDAGEAEMPEHAGTSPFIVMELVEGDTLQARRPKELDEIVSFTCQICAALEHAHAHGIIHRDLKPENVMILPDGTAKLMDFGLARSVTSRLTTEGTLVGTVFYLAPEQALGGELDHRTDLYALGVLLYELTTGGLPFTADDPFAVITQHLHAPVVPPRAKNPEIPPAFDTLIVQLLSKDPEDRPPSAAEVLQALEQPSFLDKDAAPAEELSVLERIERGRMVGREVELQEARKLWNEALSGQGQMLLISGEPGIGKTRLARELITRAEVSGGWALVGTSYAEGGTPYAAFRQTIREVLRSHSDNGLVLPEFVLADLLTLAPELCSRYPDVPANPPLEPQAEQQRLFENLVIFYTMLSDHAPLLLVLEDAHWADSGTLSLLRHLARHTRQQRVMVVATYREVELDEARPFHEVLLDLNRERLATRVKLTRLDRAQTGEMLAVLFAEEITPEFLDGIYRETEGNPFFIEEVCKALVESGKLTYEDGRWHRPSMDELGIPQSVRVTIQSRVRVLPADIQEILRLAAVLGREFDFDTLAQASELDKDTLIDGLESAERAQLIEEVGAERGGTFAFVHALIPSTLVESVRTLQRRRLHRRAAATIEAQHPDNLEALAYHYTQAGKAEQAVKYLLQVGDRARGLYAHQEAIDSYQQALEFLKEQERHEQAARTLMKLGLTYHTAFDFRRARQAYEESFALWQRAGKMEPAVPLPPAPHALRLPGRSDPLTLDPGMAWETTSGQVIDQLFSGLVELSPEMSVVPDVARSWEMLDGGRKYVFHLRDDVRWSDGTPVTAEDFAYAWRRVLDPATGSPNASLLYDVKGARPFHQGEGEVEGLGVQAVDEVTLVVELEGPTGYFLHLLAFNVTYPVPHHAVEAYGEAWAEARNIVTNGPFRLDEWKRGESLVLVRNPDYHRRFKGNVQRAERFLIAEGSTRLEMYEANELDIVGLPPWEMDRARQWHAGEYISGPLLHTFYLGFDTSRPPFDDPRVRHAFAHATDRETLADVVLRGYVFPGTGGFVPPGMPGHSTGIGLPYDPEKARQLLAEAGCPGGRGFPDIGSLMQPGLQYHESLQAQWRENLGIEITWEIEEDYGALLDRLGKESAHMHLHGWVADYPDPDNFLRISPIYRETRWRNEAYERLVEEARRVMDQGERMKMYQQADRILIEEAPIVPLGHARSHLLVKPWVRNIFMAAIGGWFLKDVIIEPH